MLKLFQMPPAWGQPSLSPFCVKTHAYFKLAKIPFEVCPGDLRNAPKGKVPYIEHEGRVIGDSNFIEEYCRTHLGEKLDQHLSARQKSIGHLARRTAEENLYHALMYMRWGPDDGFEETSRILAAIIPAQMLAV